MITPNQKEIKKIVVGNEVYYFKDEAARQAIALGMEIVVEEGELDPPSASTVGKMYLVKNNTEDDGNIYDEWITVDSGSEAQPEYRYRWEKIGTTKTDLSNYSKKTHTHTATVGNVKLETDDYYVVNGDADLGSVTPGSDASLSAGAQAQWSASVNEETEELSFSFTPNTLQTLTGGKATQVELPSFISTTLATGIKTQPTVTISTANE